MTDFTPSVSLIIPVYNAERYLPACLDSLLAQSYADFRVVLVDDGSTDSSAEICRRYAAADGRFSWVQQANQGVSAARNRGIEMVREGYIGFVDADDCLYPEALATMVRTLRETGAQVCLTAFERGVAYDASASVPVSSTRGWVKDYEQTMALALYQRYLLNSPWGMLMERRLLGETVRFRCGIRYEDLDAFYRFYERAERIAYVPRKLYFYRQTEGSFLHRWSPGRLDVLAVTDRIVDFMRERHPGLVPAAMDRRFSANYNMLLLMLRYGTGDAAQRAATWSVVRASRAEVLRNPHVRLKNKLGALWSYGGLAALRLAARCAPGLQ